MRLSVRTTAAALAVLAQVSLGAEPARAGDAPPPSASTERRAVCPVCRIREGAIAPEPVRVTREREGKTIGFCSRDCAEEFDKGPERYLAAIAAADSVAGGDPAGSLGPLAGPAPPERASGAFSGVSTAPT